MSPAGDGRWWGRHHAEPRSLLELGRLATSPAFVPLGLPRGDGRAVLLLPGFLAGDQTLGVLAAWLWRLGYRPRTCGFVANVDCSERAAERLERRIRTVYARSGRRVALIGHSRSGHFVRALAARLPGHVSHAVALGADLQAMFGISRPTECAVAAVRRAVLLTGRARHPHCLTDACGCAFTIDYAAAFPRDRVRLTSIYSKGDGVVRWQRCLVPEADCIEVTGSHTGMIFNHQCYRAIARALAEPELS